MVWPLKTLHTNIQHFQGNEIMNNLSAYGHWQVVAVNSLIFLIFVFSFFQPSTRRDWRTFGSFSAFIIALFTEMYGFPLTVYLLSGWLSSRFPEVDWFSHDAGHLLQAILGWQDFAHFGPLHLFSELFILGGLVLLVVSWRVLFRARGNYELAVTGPYARMRHPQYGAFIVIMLGFLVQWPTLPTLVMFPILVWTYVRLARREETRAVSEFGEKYTRYAGNTPRFFPRVWGDRENFGQL
jgi:protein-S-isoprenylcysteine O-methyltransferase Ste14